jgi:hypothetical protein
MHLWVERSASHSVPNMQNINEQAIQGQFCTSSLPEGAEGVQKIASLRLM